MTSAAFRLTLLAANNRKSFRCGCQVAAYQTAVRWPSAACRMSSRLCNSITFAT
jgi:hypothetical protein